MRFRIALLTPLAVAACSKSPAAKLAAQVQTAGSWTAAAALASEQWNAGLIPDQYARQVYGAASTALGDTHAKLAATGADARAIRAADSLLAPSLALIDTLSHALGDRNHAAATRAAGPLEGASKRFRAMKDSIDEAGQ